MGAQSGKSSIQRGEMERWEEEVLAGWKIVCDVRYQSARCDCDE
jgi:hypothetical protein